MTSIIEALPSTKTKVNEHTPEHINQAIQKETEKKCDSTKIKTLEQ